MNRREFLGGTIAGATLLGSTSLVATGGSQQELSRQSGSVLARDAFPRLREECYLNGAGGTPLSSFALQGKQRFEEFWQLGPGEGRGADFGKTMTDCRAAFAQLIGAQPDEIALVPNTKTGEQIVLDGMPELQESANIVTNDLHFTGSLHNLIGLKRTGVDIRIVRNADWKVTLDQMRAAMDTQTRLVCVSLVSNVNGHVEPILQLAEAAHSVGAFVYADIIQAAGVVPVDVRAMGIDFAACSSYKWLFGPHGAGFFYARKDLQGQVLKDRLFPGHVQHNYAPWVDKASEVGDDFLYTSPQDASRYQPGHVSYFGYYAVNEALKVIGDYGVDRLLQHSVALNNRLHSAIDQDRYQLITPDLEASPIATFVVDQPQQLAKKLAAENITVSLAGNRMRVSPAIYNNEEDIDRLVDVLNS